MADPNQFQLQESGKQPDGPPPNYGQPAQQGYPQGGYPPQAQQGYPQGAYPPQQQGQAPPGQPGYPQVAPTIIYQTQPNQSAAQVPNIVAAYVTSCLVFWCCNCIFGGIGFFLALAASSAIGSNNMQKAKSLWKASIIVSVVGAVITVVLLAVVLGLCYSGSGRCGFGYGYNTYNYNPYYG